MKKIILSAEGASRRPAGFRLTAFPSLIATIAMTLSLSACGGSGADSSGAFGKIPSVIADNTVKVEALAKDYKKADEAGDKQKCETLFADMMSLAVEARHEVETAGKELVGKTMDVEIVGDYGLKLDGEASISEVQGDGKVIIDVPVVTTYDVSFSEGRASKTIPSRLALVAQDKDGRSVACDIVTRSFGDYQEVYPEGHQGKFKAYIKITEYNCKTLGKCRKFILTSSESDEYKAARDFDEAEKEEYKKEHAGLSI